jgi:hypothetical protein
MIEHLVPVYTLTASLLAEPLRKPKKSADTLDLQMVLVYSSPMLTNLVGKIGNWMGGMLL